MSDNPTLESVKGPVEVPYQAFKLQTANANPLELKVFSVTCKECDKSLFAISGIMLNIDVDDNSDLLAKCECGETYSISEQSKANQEAYIAMQTLQQ
jgi:RNase P subunit RPR2